MTETNVIKPLNRRSVSYEIMNITYWNFRILHHETDKSFASPRNDKVNKVFLLQQRQDGLALPRRHDLDGCRRQICAAQSPSDNLGQGLIGMKCFRPSAKDYGIAGFQAQPGGIDCYIGS